MDLPELERLRWIKQLGSAYFLYPGALHTRFEHSLGSAYLAEVLMETLKKKIMEKTIQISNLSENDIDNAVILATKLSMLFHDIGMGPWSHSYENGVKLTGKTLKDSEFSHEDLTELIITGNIEDDRFKFIKVYLEKMRNFYKKEKDVYDKLFDPKTIASYSIGKELDDPDLKKYNFIANIISGAIDLDKLDYLVRDSFYTGIGIGFLNVWEIIDSITLKEDSGKINLAFDKNKFEFVEALWLARDKAYELLYNHINLKKIEAVLEYGISIIVEEKIDEMDKKNVTKDMLSHERSEKKKENKNNVIKQVGLLTDLELLNEMKENDLTKHIYDSFIKKKKFYSILPFNITGEQLDLTDTELKSSKIKAIFDEINKNFFKRKLVLLPLHIKPKEKYTENIRRKEFIDLDKKILYDGLEIGSHIDDLSKVLLNQYKSREKFVILFNKLLLDEVFESYNVDSIFDILKEIYEKFISKFFRSDKQKPEFENIFDKEAFEKLF